MQMRSIEIPDEPEFGSTSALDNVIERYFSTRAEVDNDGPVARGTATAQRRLANSGWLRLDLERKVRDLEYAWRRLTEHSAGALTDLINGDLGHYGSGMTQVDQHLRTVDRTPVMIRTMLDVLVNQCIVAERESTG